jgi:hypothetical protein
MMEEFKIIDENYGTERESDSTKLRTKPTATR